MLRGDRWAALQRFSRAAGHRGGSCRPVLVRPVRFLEQSSRLYSAVACAAARSEHAAARISRILGPYPADQRRHWAWWLVPTLVSAGSREPHARSGPEVVIFDGEVPRLQSSERGQERVALQSGAQDQSGEVRLSAGKSRVLRMSRTICSVLVSGLVSHGPHSTTLLNRATSHCIHGHASPVVDYDNALGVHNALRPWVQRT